MKKDTKEKLESIFTNNAKEISLLKNEIEGLNQELSTSKKELLLDILQIIDTFERAEARILENGWRNLDNVELPITRLLTAKTKTLSILRKYNITEILFENNLACDDFCKTIEVEPSNEHPNDYIISIEKKGYKVDNTVLRPAEVIVVKN